MAERDYTNGLLMGAICMLVGRFIGHAICPSVYTPKNQNKEYVNPQSIGFKVEDKDFDKQKETYVKINGKDYIFKMVNGEPRLLHYSLEHKLKTSMEEK